MKIKTPLLITVIMLGLFVTAYVLIPKSYDIYQEALDLARKDPKLTQLLGDDIDDAIFNYSHVAHGHAKFEISISGNRGEGVLIVTGRKKDNQWRLNEVVFKCDKLQQPYKIYWQH